MPAPSAMPSNTVPPRRPFWAGWWRWGGNGPGRGGADADAARELRWLERLGRGTPPGQGGQVRLAGCTFRYGRFETLLSEYRRLFCAGMHDFAAPGQRPRVVHIGAGSGLGVARTKQLYPESRVVAFEADPGWGKLLRENIRLNDWAGVEVVPAVVGACHGHVPTQPAADEVVPMVPLADYLREPTELLTAPADDTTLAACEAAGSALLHVRRLVIAYDPRVLEQATLHLWLTVLDDIGFEYQVRASDQADPLLLVQGMRSAAAPPPTIRRVRRPTDAGAPVELAAGVEPVSRQFGLDRGQPLDRYFIERFLDRHRADVRGAVLEVGDRTYTKQFGGDRVTRGDVLSPVAGPQVTVVGDLESGAQVPANRYDCFICTQTLPFVYDVAAVMRNIHGALKPGGVLLLTVPGISQVSRYDAARWGDYWRFMPQAVERLLADAFGPGQAVVETFGNVRVAAGLLDGRGAHELSPAVREYGDPDYPVVVAARAVRAEGGGV